jgi:hypothetical protein
LVGGVYSFGNTFWKDYIFQKDIGDYCSLSYESSEIDKKIEYFDKCVELLEKENLQGHSVWWFKKPDNELKNLYEVLYILQKRLHILENMKKDSFEYQTGLAQVEEELNCFVNGGGEEASCPNTLIKFNRAYCFKYSISKYYCG